MNRWIGFAIFTAFGILIFQNCSSGFKARHGEVAINFEEQAGSETVPVIAATGPGGSTSTTGTSTTGTTGTTTTTGTTQSIPFAFSSSYPLDRSGMVSIFGGSLIVPALARTADGQNTAIYFAGLDAGGSLYESVGAFDMSNPAPVWKIAMKNRGVLPTFDWDQDGVADVFVSEVNPALTTVACYSYDGTGIANGTTAQAQSSTLRLLSGKTGTNLYTTGPMPDKCWEGGLYPQWTPTSVIANGSELEFAISPYYASQAWIFKRNRTTGVVSVSAFTFPSTQSFADSYPDAQIVDNPSSGPRKFNPGSHQFNGLLFGDVLHFFTTSRLLGFSMTGSAFAPFNYDLPFIPSGVDKGDGRNYGVVARDPASSDIFLIAGCSVQSLFNDTVQNLITTDAQCGIRRHVTRVNASSHQLIGSNFFSYTNDGGLAVNAYEGRINFPSNPVLRWPSGPSSMIYNSYSAGRWNMHVSIPGGTNDLWRMKDIVVWDVIDIDQDGVDEILYSPTKLSTQPDVPGYYFPLRTTTVAHLTGSGATAALTSLKSYEGYLPAIASAPKRDHVSTSEVSLFSAVRLLGKRSSLYFIDGANKPVALDY